MIYKNYLTTPTGRYCQIRDISNEDYIILVKYLQAEDYQRFYEGLSEIAMRDIPDFDDCDIVEKCYIWLAMCMYSVRSTVEVICPNLGPQEIHIGLILNNIESQYIANKTLDYQLSDNFVLTFAYPKSFSFDSGLPIIDYYSGLIKINGELVTEEQKNVLREKLPTKHISFIEGMMREGFRCEIDLFHGVPMNSMKVNAFGEGLIANVSGFYKMPLDVYYKLMYAVIRHLRMSYTDFMKISHNESNILLKCVADENKQDKEETNKGGVQTIGQMIQKHYD